MNGGMIRGMEVLVELASEENGYVDLPPEAASNKWSLIGTCMGYYYIMVSQF